MFGRAHRRPATVEVGVEIVVRNRRKRARPDSPDCTPPARRRPEAASAVLPLPFSPKTRAVDGSAGLPKNLFHAGWWIVARQRRLNTVSVWASSSLNGLPVIPWCSQELFQLHPWQCLS